MRKIECISVFDMLKVGVGPSSSHTLGPWRAAQRWIAELKQKGTFHQVQHIHIDLYGSLSLTGIGHATDIATILGLCGHDPVTMDISTIDAEIQKIRQTGKLQFNAEREIDFSTEDDVKFNRKFLEFHPNGMTFRAKLTNGKKSSSSFYSIGGGFVVKKERKNASRKMKSFLEFPFPIEKATELLAYCKAENKLISEIVLENEKSLRSPEEINSGLKQIWDVMLESMYIGCHTEGTLPGGLNVKRRSFEMHQRLIADEKYDSPEQWISAIRRTEVKFRQILKWVSCFAISVNEVNASLGRVVTAPTNGSAGTVPSVMMYYMVIENHQATFEDMKRFMLVAGEIGSLFKKGATISAAMGGCQAEIGVSSAMAAGGLTELLGGTPEQVLMAAEIAMEHHLGLTCDPIAGLVQVPCIERNAMGAIKAINAAEIALESDATKAKVPLDKVIETMWDTAKDMNSKYKETSEGGLAVKVNLSDC
ncbi:L-serine dehydratase [Salegentibacter sp. 24]|uniref:L-serine ammonia-lyase n=1 Tax=Salegentibacter sp. 24 TaxID=2183986 RepID=UPI001060FF34|nr:L-serine ammonia-lyase [Salegentibacter sp. 24]TDN87579.1 L-serine dehydratase [Salegentibacter sp. 24]